MQVLATETMITTTIARAFLSTFRLGIAKSFTFQLVPTKSTPQSSSPNLSLAADTTNANTTQLQQPKPPIVLAPSSFSSAETLNATLDKHLVEGESIEMWVPASILRPPSDNFSGSPLLLESIDTTLTSTASIKSSPTTTAPLAQRPQTLAEPIEPEQLLAEWQSQGIESIAARDLSPHADPATHLPIDLLEKLSPHASPRDQQGVRATATSTNKRSSAKVPIPLASQQLVFASSNAKKDLLMQALLTADPNDECAAHGAAPLHLLASTHADKAAAIECLHILLEHGALVDKRASNGSTPLHWACGNGNLDVAKILLECGADPSCMTFTWFRDVFGKHSGQTPLHWAAESGHEDIVKMLADQAPWIVGSIDERGSTPSALALREAKFDVHSTLMEREEETYVLLRAKLDGVVAVPMEH